MTDTTPDYAGLIERLRKPGTWARHGDDIIASDAKEELVRDDAPFEAATALRTLLESNAALELERTNLIETKREQIGRLNTRIAELERERNQLLDKLHCMCGSPIDHSAWEGHTPVSVYDYSLDQERSRAEAAEAKLAEAMKVIGQIDTALNDQFEAGIEEREGGSARRQERLMKSGEELRRAARKLLKENGNG